MPTGSTNFSESPSEPGLPPGYNPIESPVQGLIQGNFAAMPLGVILHGSRSGIERPTNEEFNSTVGYVKRGTDGTVGWNATIGDDRVCEHIVPSNWGWNAREASKLYLAVEFAQPTEAYPILDGQVRAFAWWFLNVARVAWPDLPAYFPTHAELPAGIKDGKTDVFSRGSDRADELRSRVASLLGFRAAPG